jgi:uncharacterized protein (DUF1697 family)
MAVYVALLRGVNVGGKNRLPNATLKAACESAGFTDVHVYLQSGNVVFKAPKQPRSQIVAKLRQAILEAGGLDVAVLLRTADELRAVLSTPPFDDLPDDHGSRLVVVFLDAKPNDSARGKVEALRAGDERLKFGTLEVFGYFPEGMGRSKLANSLHDRKLGVACTARNWNTVNALAELAETLEAPA